MTGYPLVGQRRPWLERVVVGLGPCSAAECPVNLTERPPLPMFQLTEGHHLTRALEGHPYPEGIPLRDTRRLGAKGSVRIRAPIADRGH